MLSLEPTATPRLQRIANLSKKVRSRMASPHRVLPPRELDNRVGKAQNLMEIMIQVLWGDMRLLKTINLFPLQCQQLQKTLPQKELRQILKMINTMIPSSKKQVKDFDSDWKQQAICALQHCHQWWSKRLQNEEYKQLTNLNNPSQFEAAMQVSFNQYMLDGKVLFTRGLLMRYLQDID